jgi:membrane associated rhomboid family serine protease
MAHTSKQKSSPFPQPLRTLLWALFSVSALNYFLNARNASISNYFTLSQSSVSNGYIWTFFTYPFCSPYNDLFDYLAHLTFNLFFLWVFGLPLYQRLKAKKFSILLAGGTVVAGGGAFLCQILTQDTTTFSGLNAPLISLVTCWTILNSSLTFDKAKTDAKPSWVFIIFAASSLFIDLLKSQWTNLSADCSAIVFSYLFCLIIEKTQSSIKPLSALEQLILKLSSEKHIHRRNQKAKIYDFKTGEPIPTDNELLEKAKKVDAKLLTEAEKRRLKDIHKKRKDN